VRLAFDLVFALMLIAVSIADLRRRVIPNRVLALAAVCGLPLLAVTDLGSMPAHGEAALLAGGAFLAISLGRPDGLGMGDVKLVAAMGFFLAGGVLGAVLVALGAASAIGLAMVIRDGRAAAKATIPFGPFLALGGILALLGWIPSLQ
jgi:leader peptidase (prepilin peptidase)/N-methyltransferase